jgi:hypothetical protein
MSQPDSPQGGIVVRRIRFASHSVTSGRVCRTFKHPRLCLAVDEPAKVSDLPKKPEPSAPGDELFVVFVQPKAVAEWEEISSGRFFTSTDPDAPSADVKWKEGRVQWQPGLAVVYLRGALQEEVLSALVEFAFYESELRRLEAEMDTREATAFDDVSRAHTIQRRDKGHWPRFTAAIEAFTRMRLAFARLSPRFVEAARGPGSFSYRLASRLLQQARTEARAEALDTRLEACEELYEGGNDRVADHKGWYNGHILEVIIVAILLVEVVLLCVDLVVRGGE